MKNGPYELVIPPPDYPGKRYRDRYAYEHHVVWWQNTGYVLEPGFEVHHKNENKRDNRFDNLELLTKHDHQSGHSSIKEEELVRMNCGWCSKEIVMLPSRFRTRMKNNKFGKVFCDYSCGAKHQFSIN